MCSSDSLSRCHCVPVGSVAAAGGDVEAGLAVGAVRARVLGRGGDVPELFVADRRGSLASTDTLRAGERRAQTAGRCTC